MKQLLRQFWYAFYSSPCSTRFSVWPVLVQAPASPHQVKRPSFYLIVDAGEILADDSQCYKLHTAEEQYRHHDRGVARNHDAADDSQPDQKERIEEGEDRD